MAIAVATTKQTVCNAYTAIGNYIGCATADPGTTSTPANESSGGGYARLTTTWTPGSGGVSNGSATTINLPASTVTFMFVATAATGNTMFDKASIGSNVLSTAGQLVITPTMTVT